MSVKLSIITVVFNGESEIEKTILSVINQTYENVEYIIVDGNSKDGTLNIINKYRKNINFLVCEDDAGIYDAMNKGIDLATGDFINFLNCGDYFADDLVLEKMEFEKYQGLDLIYGDHYFLDKGSKKLIKALDFTFHNVKNYTTMVACHQSLFINKNVLTKFSLKYKLKCELEQYFLLSRKEINYKRHNFPIVCFSEGGLGSIKIILNSYERIRLMFVYSPYNALKNIVPFFIHSLKQKLISK